MSNDEMTKDKILSLLQNVIEQDKSLRDKHQVGDKFRFIRDRLNSLLSHLETSLTSDESKKQVLQTVEAMTAEECIVFVYLFNAHGLSLQTWQKMLNASVFYEHSVNRPIYSEKSHVESFIRGKKDKAQHGYLSVVIKKTDIIQPTGAEAQKDTFGHPIIKVREGSLKFNKLISFTHNGHEYIVNENGGIVKKG